MALNFRNQTVSTDYIDAAASLVSYPFTINCWFYPTLDNVGNNTMFLLHNTTNNDRFDLAVFTTTKNLSFRAFVGPAAGATTTATYTTNAWNMATGVGTSSTSRTVYLNGGNSVTNTTSRAVTTPTYWTVGANYTTTGGFSPVYEGYVAEIAIWNVALGAADIAALYSGAKPTQVVPQSLKIYAPLVRNVIEERGSTTSISTTGTVQADHVRRYG